MGLSQTIKFDYSDKDEIIQLINNFKLQYKVDQSVNFWVIHTDLKEPFRIEISIETWGCYIHRSGHYFQCLGQLIENLTGQFGRISIEDI